MQEALQGMVPASAARARREVSRTGRTFQAVADSMGESPKRESQPKVMPLTKASSAEKAGLHGAFGF